MSALRKTDDATPTVAALPDRPTDILVSMIHRGRVVRGTVNTKLPYGVGNTTRFYPAPRMPCADETLVAVKEVADLTRPPRSGPPEVELRCEHGRNWNGAQAS